MSKMNTSKVTHWGAWLLVILSATGCANTPYADAPQWGQSMRHALKMQALNPQASRVNPSAPGADGTAMKSAIDRYLSSFEQPPPPVNVLNIGLGGSAGSTGR